MQINIYIDFKLSREIKTITQEYIKRLKPLHGGIGVKLNVNYFKNIKELENKNMILLKIKSTNKTMDSINFANYLLEKKSINFLITDFDYNETIALTTIFISKESQLILLIEQIYRSTTIWNNTKYHK